MCPRIAETAKTLWLIYVLLYNRRAIGVGLPSVQRAFDAIGHSFATIAGGFSTHDASVGYFNSPDDQLHHCHLPADLRL